MNKKYLFVTLIALFAVLVSACAGAVTEAPIQADDPQAGAPSAPESQSADNDDTSRQDNPQQGRANQNGRDERDLTAAAEALGVTVEELQAALQSSIHADCANLSDEDTQPGNREGCRPDLTIAAETLGVTVEELQAALGGPNRDGRGDRGERDLTAAAEALGITVEELQAAFDAAKPAECVDGEAAQGVDCRPDMDTVASTLGVTVEELQAALGNKHKGLDFAAAAETLGVTEEELQQAFEAARPAECAATEEGAPKDPNCRADLETVASTLGVTVEELEQALGKPEGGRGPQGGQPPAQP